MHETLNNVVNKVKEIADRDHSGLVYDNILTIFNKLKTAEKRILLKGLMNLSFIVSNTETIDDEKLSTERSRIIHHRKPKLYSQSVRSSDHLENLEKEKADIDRNIVKIKKIYVKAAIVAGGTIVLGVAFYFTNFEAKVYDNIVKGLLTIVKAITVL